MSCGLTQRIYNNKIEVFEAHLIQLTQFKTLFAVLLVL